MALKEYAVGETVYIAGIEKYGELSEGRVVHKFALHDEGYRDNVFYVVEVPTAADPLLEIRTWDAIADSPDGELHCWMKTTEFYAQPRRRATDTDD